MSGTKHYIPQRLQLQEERAETLEFWRLQYTRRKFRKDVVEGILDAKEIAVAYADLEKTAKAFVPELERRYRYTDWFLVIFDHKCTQYFPKYNWTWQQSQILYLSDVAIFSYHNANFLDPKYICEDKRCLPVLDIADAITNHCRNSLKILHQIIFHYGFFLIDLDRIYPPQAILARLNNGDALPPPRDCFLKKGSDEWHECRFNYKTRSGDSFFEAEKSGFLYLYYNVLNSSFDPERETANIPGHIKRYKQHKTVGEEDSANIQVCIRMRSNALEYEEIKTWCYYGILRYQRWMQQQPLEDIGQALNVIINGRKGDSVSDEARAFGLLLWDAVHLEGKKISQLEKELAFNRTQQVDDDKIQEKFTAHPRSASLRPQFYQDLRFTEYCVDNMEALTVEDWRKKRQWMPNIKKGRK